MTHQELVDTLRGPLRNFSYRLPAADAIEQLLQVNADLQSNLERADAQIFREQDTIRRLYRELKRATKPWLKARKVR